ncbi:MAG: holo-ACP synthase [Bacillota bacterium]|nr:holo-ACP synthase [Bacillota bacterium]
MITGIGVDIVNIERVNRLLESSFIERCFTENEISYFEKRKFNAETIAGNFAAKEAFTKAIGTGFIGFDFKSVEVLHDNNDKPYFNFLKEYANITYHLSITHEKEYAVAFVVAENRGV